MGYWNGYYPPYVPVAEKKAKAARKLRRLKKKNPDIRPIAIEGRLIAHTWWGKSWNKNLERYADYRNRIGRGRSYVRHGAVLDLRIHSGEVKALVMGSGSKPYSVHIKIRKIDNKVWKSIKTECQGKLESLPELMTGKFPKALGEIFTAKGQGLFPSPQEIQFDCSCPDWASMCKHVAAVLYGVGARLDEDPSLFFKLRKIDVNDLITQAVEEKTRKLLKKSENKSARVIEDSNLSDIFGIEMDEPVRTSASEEEHRRVAEKKAVAKAEVLEKTDPQNEPIQKVSIKKSGKKELKIKIGKSTISFNFQLGKNTSKAKPVKRAVKKEPVKKMAEKISVSDTVADIVRRSRKGLTVNDIQMKTGFDVRQIRNAIYTAKKKGKIKSVKRGVYKKA